MELDSVQRSQTVLQCHHFRFATGDSTIGPSRDFEIPRKAVGIDHEAVVLDGIELVRDAFEEVQTIR